MTDNTLLVLISGITGLFGSGGVYAWFKLRAEKGKITVDAAQGAVIIQASVLKSIQEDYLRLAKQVSEMEMEMIAKEEEYGGCRKKILKLELTVEFLQRDLDRHGRMTELARRRSHVALNTIGNYELLIDTLLSELREHEIPVEPELKSFKVRSKFQEEMAKIDQLEALVTEEAVKSVPPTIRDEII